MRHAIIKDGKVVDIILVGWNYAAQEGQHLVPHDTAQIGDSYDGTAFTRPQALKSELITHARARSHELPFAAYRVGALTVSVDAVDHIALARFADRARNDKGFTVDWPQPRHDGRVVHLNAEQIIELNDAVTEYFVARARALSAMLQAIHDGQITNHHQVDHPPATLPQWPPRFNEPPK
jgi:hypothetical protein